MQRGAWGCNVMKLCLVMRRGQRSSSARPAVSERPVWMLPRQHAVPGTAGRSGLTSPPANQRPGFTCCPKQPAKTYHSLSQSQHCVWQWNYILKENSLAKYNLLLWDSDGFMISKNDFDKTMMELLWFATRNQLSYLIRCIGPPIGFVFAGPFVSEDLSDC